MKGRVLRVIDPCKWVRLELHGRACNGGWLLLLIWSLFTTGQRKSLLRHFNAVEGLALALIFDIMVSFPILIRYQSLIVHIRLWFALRLMNAV